MDKKPSQPEGQRNVGEEPGPIEVQEPTYLPCFLCDRQLEIKSSKRKKPYFICDPCGLQAFVRKEQGIQLLAEMTTPVLEIENGVLKTLSQLKRVNQRIEDIEGDKPWFSEDAELELAQKALQIEKRRLLRVLNDTGKIKTPDKPARKK